NPDPGLQPARLARRPYPAPARSGGAPTGTLRLAVGLYERHFLAAGGRQAFRLSSVGTGGIVVDVGDVLCRQPAACGDSLCRTGGSASRLHLAGIAPDDGGTG